MHSWTSRWFPYKFCVDNDIYFINIMLWWVFDLEPKCVRWSWNNTKILKMTHMFWFNFCLDLLKVNNWLCDNLQTTIWTKQETIFTFTIMDFIYVMGLHWKAWWIQHSTISSFQSSLSTLVPIWKSLKCGSGPWKTKRSSKYWEKMR